MLFIFYYLFIYGLTLSEFLSKLDEQQWEKMNNFLHLLDDDICCDYTLYYFSKQQIILHYFNIAFKLFLQNWLLFTI